MPVILAAEVTPDAAMTNLGSVLTQMWTWISAALTTITSQPILLLGLGIFVVGAIIGLTYRLIHG